MATLQVIDEAALIAIQERARSQVTEGPWVIELIDGERYLKSAATGDIICQMVSDNPADAELLASAVQDIARLCAELQAQRQ